MFGKNVVLVYPLCMTRPIILATCDANTEHFQLRKGYARAVQEHHAELLVAPLVSDEGIEELILRTDGLLLSGGDDIHPRHYGEAVAPFFDGKIDEERFALEQKLITKALDHKKPILGICRGMQVLNVFFGGSLYQDIPNQLPNALPHKIDLAHGVDHLAHDVDVIEGTELHRIILNTHISTNSFHHQAVKDVAPVLRANAYATDGLIEGIEHPLLPFVIGVEWHPESLDDDASRRLFEAFITAAAAR